MPVAHKSSISVGLLYIPVGLYKTTRDAGISFNQLCSYLIWRRSRNWKELWEKKEQFVLAGKADKRMEESEMDEGRGFCLYWVYSQRTGYDKSRTGEV